MRSRFFSTLVLSMMYLLLMPQLASAKASPDGVWSAQPSVAARADNAGGPAAPAVYQLNHGMLQRIIAAAPPEGAVACGLDRRIFLPTPEGEFLSFRIERSSVMAPGLAAKYPDIETFRGQGADDPTTSVRFSRTALGFQATVVTPGGVYVVAPRSRGDLSLYVATKIDGSLDEMFQCLLDAFAPGAGTASELGPIVALGAAPSGTQLRTYRLAVAATGEYTEFLGSQALAIASIATTVNGVNAIYEVEVAVRLVLVDDNDDIVYTDPDTDPFPLANKNAETQAAIDSEIGDANYDIGHLFHKAGASISGNAGCIACVCTTGNKGSAWSQGPDPTNGNFLFVVAHEMGHQHGGRHTFNGTGCPAGAYSATTSWEPGSGTTIMSYSSICGADNVLGNQVGDLYFHAGSRQEITTYTQTAGGSACGTTAATGNAIPIISAGLDYTIPQGTPFELTASGNDPDGDALTYTWEQFDLGPRSALTTVDEGSIPLFRSFPPSSDATRTFPAFQDLLDGAGSLFPSKLGEQLPSTDRLLTFRTTARDNRAGGGGADDDDLVLTVLGDPFAITAPTAGGGLECNATSNITWDIGGGYVAATVDALLSTDGGSTFPTVLAANTLNDGAEAVTGPGTLTNDARIRLNSVGNVFFALSDQIAIQDTLPPAVSCPANATAECTGNNGIDKTDPALAAFFAGASATDLCDASVPAPTDDAPAFLPLGDTSVTFSSTDASSNLGSCSATVSVVDTAAPTISVSLTPDQLFPAPNHKMRKIRATVTVEDTCDPSPSVVLTSITSNEPENGLGDGDTAPDIEGADYGTEDYTFFLRSERSGTGTGRIYTVTYTVTDGSGNTASAEATVTVALSARNR